ncbi:hypothetical protein J3R82DRAFT_5411 [Butyriboletus roseoflavus]|nr:hypothetical protein J3R82DRAFT_5411 [Butyriboletus roseoflavus]
MSTRQSIGVVFPCLHLPAVHLLPPTLLPPSLSTAQAVTSASTGSPSPVVATTSSSTSNAGTIAGAVIGGVVFLVLALLGILLYLRARKRNRTPPSYEFMNALKAGATPVLRLDSGAEYTPTLPEKAGGYTHHPPPVPLPFMQDSYYTSPPMQNMRFPDAMMTDIPSARPSVEAPLHPRRFSSQHVNNSFVSQHHPSAECRE